MLLKISFGCVLLNLVIAGIHAPATAAEPPRRIYIAPDDHTDYVWSGDEEAYRQAFLEMIDYYLDQADRTANDIPEHQSRWNCDGSLWMWTYERNKTQAEFQRFLRRVRDGHISVPLNALVSCYGATPLEAILRGMYYPGRIERRHGLRFPLAVAMENQTLPYGLGALWAGSGARYSWKGICGCASQLIPVRHQRRPHEIYWWNAPDGSRILMKWNSLLNDSAKISNQCLGGYAEAFDPARSLEFVESDARFRSVWPYSVVGIFGKGWDRLKTTDTEVVSLARKETTPQRRIIVSNEEDFFRDFEKTYGGSLPSFSAAFGNEWDLYVASVTELNARMRRSAEKLRTAEALATLVSLKRPEFLHGREQARDQAFMNFGIFWEHNWTSDGPIQRQERARWGRRLVGEVESYVNALETDAAHALGTLIRTAGSSRRFYVFNPLGWTRTDAALLVYEGTPAVHVVDVESAATVPSQIVTCAWTAYNKGGSCLQILARNVPPAGYRVYEIRPGDAPQAAVIAAEGNQLENWRYRVSLANRGAITSLVDKSRGRELIRTIDGFAANDLGPAEGRITLESSGPVAATLRAAVASPISRVSRLTLYRDLDRIDIANEITQNFNNVQMWRFGFNFDSPDVWHEEVGAVIRARLTSEGGHYSPVHARLDWLTLNHFVSISGAGGVGIVLSSPDLSFMKLGQSQVSSGLSKLDTATPQLSVLAGGQVDGPRLGIPGQGGDTSFLQRFALRAHTGFDPVESMKFALEHQNPLLAANVSGGTLYPEKTFSLASLSDSRILLWALKPADEGIENGVVVRLWNLTAEPRSFSFSLAPGLASAQRVTHVETAIAGAKVTGAALTDTVAPAQLATWRLIAKPLRTR